jgi:endoglycosylceramidase
MNRSLGEVSERNSIKISDFSLSQVRLNENYSGTGFTHVPGGNEYRNRSVLSYHYYCTIIQIIPVPGNDTIPIFDRVVCDDVEGPALFRSALVCKKKYIPSSLSMDLFLD